jgi:hypothetical protein
LTRKGKVLRPKGVQAQAINLILEKLMLFCLTDPDQEIIISGATSFSFSFLSFFCFIFKNFFFFVYFHVSRAVLQSLDPCLDRFLCQPEFMEDLFLFFVCDVLEVSAVDGWRFASVIF